MNVVRASSGLPRIRGAAILARSAGIRARAIVRCGEFSHTPCGQSFTTPFHAVGYSRGRYSVGENLAWMTGAGTSPAQVVRMWLASPPHRRVLLSRGWRELGATAVVGTRLFGQPVVTVWVAQFGRRG